MHDTNIGLRKDMLEDFDVKKNQINLPNSNVDDSTPIQDFYKDQTIFITGATGFLGTLLVEKLLRCCPQIRRLILLVRNRGEKTVDDRLKEYFNEDVFDQIRMQDPNYYKRVAIVCGALDAENYGLSLDDERMLTAETSVVFHIAATVRFDEHIRTAFEVNVKGTETALQLSKRMPRLKSFVHVSTAYCNCEQEYIEEKFYPPTFTAEKLSTLVSLSSDQELSVLLQHILGRKPNTYTLTKATAEELVREAARDMPVCVFRPSIVFPTLEEPLPLWLKGLNGCLAFLLVGGIGLLRVGLYDPDQVVDLVPGDRTINALTALAWYQTTLRSGKEESKVFNFVSYNDNRLLQSDVLRIGNGSLESDEESCSQQLWKRHHYVTKNHATFFVLFYIIHSIPALVFSIAERLTNRKPLVMKIYRKIIFNFLPMTYFSLRQWRFENSNTQGLVSALSDADRKRFDASMANFRWEAILSYIHRAVALYILKDPLTKEYYQKHIVTINRIDFCIWAVIYTIVGYGALHVLANQINSHYGFHLY